MDDKTLNKLVSAACGASRPAGVNEDATAAESLHRMRLVGSDCGYTGKGDGPFYVEPCSSCNGWRLCSADDRVLHVVSPNDYGPGYVMVARSLAYFLNWRTRLNREPTPVRDWQPPMGVRYAEEREAEIRDAEEAQRELEQNNGFDAEHLDDVNDEGEER